MTTLLLAASFLFVGVVGPNFVSIYSIPSISMSPTLLVGDAVLVEKVSLSKTPPKRGDVVFFRPPARLVKMLASLEDRQRALDAAEHARVIADKAHAASGAQSTASSRLGVPDVSAAGLRKIPMRRRLPTRVRRKDLFVKRVAAVAGDTIEVRGNDVIVNGLVVDVAAPGSPDVSPRLIPMGFVFVLGDNGESSLDSRYWGLLPVEYVVGRPLARIFPPDRFDVSM